MKSVAIKSAIVEKLKEQILSMEGFRHIEAQGVNTGLGCIEHAFPRHVFPTGVIHEFISPAMEHRAATTGFMAGLISRLMGETAPCLWISTKRMLFPPALQLFGVDPNRIIFIDLTKEKDVLWTIEEALKCDTLSIVVGELNEISFSQSRRLQLAVEQSRVTGFMHCHRPDKIHHTTAVARWKVSPLASMFTDDMPGVGFPRWNVELLKIRNGRTGAWELEWSSNRFKQLHQHPSASGIRLDRTA